MRRDPERCKAARQAIIHTTGPLKLIIGSAHIASPGWIDTDQDVLDILSEKDWQYLLEERQADRLLAEHVLEHIEPEKQLKSLKFCYNFLSPGGVLRLAVPDGYRTDPVYQEEVRPPKDGHTMMFNHHTLSSLLEQSGFKVKLLEFFDEQGCFHYCPWDSEGGLIRRSLKHDNQTRFHRVQGAFNMNYTSLIADAAKPGP